MSRVLVETEKAGLFINAADPDGKPVRKRKDDDVFKTLDEAKQALSVLEKVHGPEGANGGSKAKTTVKAAKEPVEKEPLPETVAPTGKVLVGKTVTIKCKHRGCKETRVIKPQDAFQVKYCVEHQKEHARIARNEKAKQRNAAKREAAKATK